MRDSFSDQTALLALSPAVQAATIKGNTIDVRSNGKALFVVNTGAIVGSGNYTAKLQESVTTTDGDFTDVAPADLRGTLPASLTADASFKQGYIGKRPYVRVVITKNSGTSIAVGAVAVLGNPAIAPVA